MQTEIIDPIEIMTFERNHNVVLTADELSMALDNEGFLSIERDGKWLTHEFEVLLFPLDLTTGLCHIHTYGEVVSEY